MQSLFVCLLLLIAGLVETQASKINVHSNNKLETERADHDVVDLDFKLAEAREYFNISGYIFFISEIFASFNDAELECNSLGMRLFFIESAEKQALVELLVTSTGHEYQSFWTSGKRVQDDVFIWTSTGENFNYTNWLSGEPNEPTNSPDASVVFGNVLVEYMWYDYIAREAHAFICEF